nr:ribonuclease H-like domain, reverse transcriptase, RNA-dependent DNA polymerase [Tanacetum cinerariifolium]
MQIILEANGLWEMIEPNEKTQEDNRKDKTAIVFLYQALPEDQLLQITKHKTAKAIWDALKTRHIGEERVQQARIKTNEQSNLVEEDLEPTLLMAILEDDEQEVNVLSKLRHQNLVTLIGVCPDAWTIVYEYLSGGSLEDRLAGDWPFVQAHQLAVLAMNCCDMIRQNRPDLASEKAIRQVLRYVKGTKDYGITYKHNRGNKIHGYNDSSYRVNTQEGKGTTGIIFYYGESPISWSTQKQATVALSSCESEFIVATTAATQALWLKRLLSKLTHSEEDKVTIKVDNKSAIALMKNPVFHGRSKHIDTKYHFIRECVEKEDIQVEFETMQDSVVAGDGFTYKAEAIKGRLDSGHNTSPMTNLKLANSSLVPNHALRSAIQEWLQQP